MTSWEYLIVLLPEFQGAKVHPGESASVSLLNREGAEGWEAVGMTAVGDSFAVLLKRPNTSGYPGNNRPAEAFEPS